MAKLKQKRERVTNDFGKRCAYKVAMELWHLYIRTRKLGLNKEMAARYAMYSVEGRSWHSRPINHLPDLAIKDRRTKWPRNNRIVATPQRLLSLINSPRHTDYQLADLDNEADHLDFCVEYMESREGWSWENAAKAIENYESITGIKVPNYELMHMWGVQIVNQWAKVSRGRDLFVKGFGTFDIDKAVTNATTRERTYYQKICLQMHERGLWPISINDLRAHGYDVEGHRWIFDVLDRSNAERRAYHAPLRNEGVLAQYVRRWWHQIKDPEFEEHRYDLSYMDTEIIDIAVPPAKLMVRWHEFREARTQEQARLRKMEGEEQDLYNRKHHYESWIKGMANANPPRKWNWVDQVFQTKELGNMRLVALDSYDKLKAVGKALKNCAACYDKTCAMAEGLMVVLEKKNGEGVYKPYALCRYNPDGAIGEARITCNRNCPPTIRKLFAQHAKAWNQDKYNYLPKKIEELKKAYPPLTEEKEERRLVAC